MPDMRTQTDPYHVDEADPRFEHADLPGLSDAELRAELSHANLCPHTHPCSRWWTARAAQIIQELDRREGKGEARAKPATGARSEARPRETHGRETERRETRRREPEAPPRPEPRPWTVDGLLDANFPEPKWVVPDILPTGLAALAGRPKIGKSWLALPLAVAVASGGYFLERRVESGPVLYLALEDSPRRLKSRLEKMGWALRGLPLTFYTEWPSLSDTESLLAFEARLAADRPRLVVLDTLTRAWGRLDWNDLGDTTDAMARLQTLALAQDCAILCVDHHRKGNGMAADPVDDIIGSTGKSAGLDAVWGLYRKRGERGATLKATGRDIDEVELAIEFDPVTGCWQLLGDAQEVALDTTAAEILAYLEESGPTTCDAIAKATEKPHNTIWRALERLKARRQVEATKRPKQGGGYRVEYSIIQSVQSGKSVQSGRSVQSGLAL